MNMVQEEVFGEFMNYFKRKNIPITIFGVGMALEKNKRSM